MCKLKSAHLSQISRDTKIEIADVGQAGCPVGWTRWPIGEAEPGWLPYGPGRA